MNSNIISWNGIDMYWAYSQLLPSIQKQGYCSQRSLDILHDALIRFVVSLSPNRHEKPHAYLHTIVQHLIADEYQRARRYSPLDVEPIVASRYILPSTEHLADINQRLIYTQSLIDTLPKKCREVFWLYRIEGYTQVEIAAKLGISKNMVERHMMRAIVDLSSAKEWIMEA